MRKLALFLLSFILLGCHDQSPNTLRIGTIAGPETDLVEIAKKVAKDKYNLNIKIVEFNDYNLPNEALNDGNLDANIYQHQPYLTEAIKTHNYHLAVLGKTFLYPVGLYSSKYKSLQTIPDGASIALPNDPSNEARALLLLQQAHLIKLGNIETASIKDIKENPHHFRFHELDAAQLPRILPDVDAAIINTTFALPAGLKPSRDALIVENTESPYVNLIVINTQTNKKEQLEQFVKAFQSDEVKQEAKALFDREAIPAW